MHVLPFSAAEFLRHCHGTLPFLEIAEELQDWLLLLLWWASCSSPCWGAPSKLLVQRMEPARRAEPGVCQRVQLGSAALRAWPALGIPAQPHLDTAQCTAQSGLEPLGTLRNPPAALGVWESSVGEWARLSSAMLLAFQMMLFWLFHQCHKLAHKISSAVPLKIRNWVHPKWWDGLKWEDYLLCLNWSPFEGCPAVLVCQLLFCIQLIFWRLSVGIIERKRWKLSALV